jgi:F-type H+-transporting ATPase subunit b
MHIIPDLGPSLALAIPFFVAFFGLWVILWKPLMQFLDGREHATEGARAEAAHLAHEADARATDLEQRLAAARKESIEIRAAARARSHVKEAEIVAAARLANDERVTAAQARIGAERDQARTELESHARTLSNDIVDTLLA